MTNESLFLVHLSDIHFPDTGGDYYDLDDNLRNEVEIDLKALLDEVDCPPDAILVTGDIAKAGAGSEYAIATDWLQTLHNTLGCPPQNVWVVPGNHDADRRVVKENQALKLVRDAVSDEPETTRAAKLSDLLRSSDGLFFSPLTEYNRFAAPYQCEISARTPYWDSELEGLGGINLRLRGMNSTLMCNMPGKRDEPGALILGEFQVPRRLPGAVQLSLCHHPIDWLWDASSVGALLDRSTQIQLFGHVHEHQVDVNDSRIRLVAGAVHPHRSHDWAPGYNCLRVTHNVDAKEPSIVVTVFPRIWSAAEGRFVSSLPDSNSESHQLRIHDNPQPEGSKGQTMTQPTTGETTTSSRGQLQRNLAFCYLRLSYVDRVSIAQELGLLDQDDEQCADVEKFRNILRRVHERGLESEFTDKIDQIYEGRPTKHE